MTRRLIFFFAIFKRLLLWCFNPSSTLKNNCFLLIIFTSESWLILLHSSIVAVLQPKVCVVYFSKLCMCNANVFLVKCFVFLIILFQNLTILKMKALRYCMVFQLLEWKLNVMHFLGAFWNVVKTGQTHFPVFFNYIFHFSSWRHTLFKVDCLK